MIRKSLGWFLISIFSAILFFHSVPVFAQENECPAARVKWEQVYNDLRSKLQDFSTIQQTPVDRIIQRPLLDRSESRTIARQVSEALQSKEELLNTKRKECRNLINLENQAFNELQDCMQNGKGSKDKDAKNFAKKRQALVEKAVLTLAEVKEVEGKETVTYSENYNPDPYHRSANNQWQNYQQMYRRYWGQ